MMIQEADNEEKISKCWKVIFELRPHLHQNDFVATVKAMQAEGVKLFFIEENGMAVSAAAFRVNYYFARGLNVYIDDLSTLPDFRGKGYAKALLDAIKKFAIQNNCDSIHLDSGHHRYEAHRLYLNFGFKITSHHFTLNLR